MLKSQYYEMNLPELGDQYNVKDWNDNTEQIDTLFHTMNTGITKLETDTVAITNQEIDAIMAQ